MPTPASDPSRPARRAAVIDVGSNSVRLVTYRVDGRSIWTIHNEKALAGLGRDLPATGRLSKRGVDTAMAALRRFARVLQDWPDAAIYTAATAAVRESEDGQAFLRRIETETGLKVRLLSGREEARYAALGVVAGEPGAEGLIGDLGGSSLELVRLEGQEPADGVTLKLGPFALGAPQPIDIGRTRRAVDKAFAPLVERFSGKTFHAVGGGWRNLALFHMSRTAYPLRVAHQYVMSRHEAIDTARLVARQSRSSLERIEGLSKKRAETLPYAAVVLEALLEAFQIEQVVVSAFGVREGLLYEAMDAATRAEDPLIAGCETLTEWQGLTEGLGPALFAWGRPLLARLEPGFEREPILAAAACRLAELGARFHPDHRADLVFEQVLRAPIAGMSHPERAMLACAAFARHTTAQTFPEPQIVERLLKPEQVRRARAIGAMVRLGCDISGRNAPLLARTRLTLEGEAVSLTADPAEADLILGEQVQKRAAALAEVLGRPLRLGASTLAA
ncbi:MAG TPA: Ppx/GppA phosphatase family protein [Phenylobacterium sp.]|nr:Ppx/GppA phosphatase family protein [Phenylobacterium sp.]